MSIENNAGRRRERIALAVGIAGVLIAVLALTRDAWNITLDGSSLEFENWAPYTTSDGPNTFVDATVRNSGKSPVYNCNLYAQVLRDDLKPVSGGVWGGGDGDLQFSLQAGEAKQDTIRIGNLEDPNRGIGGKQVSAYIETWFSCDGFRLQSDSKFWRIHPDGSGAEWQDISVDGRPMNFDQRVNGNP